MSHVPTLDAVMLEIDLATEPKVMSKEEAIRFLEMVCTDCEGRIEALRDELREQQSGEE